MKLTPEEIKQAVKELRRYTRERTKEIILSCNHHVLTKYRPLGRERKGYLVYTCEDCEGTVTVVSGLSIDDVIKRMEDSYAKF